MTLQTATAPAAPPKGKALPGVAAPADTGITIAGVRQIPHDLIDPSPLNPRNSQDIDPEALAELKSSILTQGILQNLVVRPHPKKDGRFEIAAGERRWRAMDELIHDGDKPKDAPVPALVRDLSDRQLVELALTENVQRGDLTPMEEAHAFKRLVDMGVGTDEIADQVGCSRRHVQLRLALLKLHPKAQKALVEGTITTEHARKLAQAPEKRQVEVLESIVEGINDGYPMAAEDVAEAVKETMVPVEAAKFDLQLYAGEFFTPEDEPGEKYFADVGQFERLQRDWIKSEKKALAVDFNNVWEEHETHGAVDDKTRLPYEYTKAESKDNGALILIGQNMTVVVFKGVKKARNNEYNPVRASSSGTATGTPQPELTKAFLATCRNRKTMALQAAAAADPEFAKRALCLALMAGTHAVRLRIDRPRQDDDALSPQVVAAAERFRGRFGKLLAPAPVTEDGWDMPLELDGGRYGHGDEKREAAAAEILATIGGDELDQLLAVLTAPLVGSFNNYMPELGDEPAALALAKISSAPEELKATFTIDDEFLGKCRGAQLLRIIKDNELSLRDAGGATGPKMRALIKAGPIMPGYVPPWCRFGTEREIKELIREPKVTVHTIKTSAAPAAKKKTKTAAKKAAPPTKKKAAKKPAKAKGKKK